MKTNVWKRTLSIALAMCMLFSISSSLCLTAAAETESYYSEDFEEITELDWIPKNHAGSTPTDDDLAKSYASVEADPLKADNKVMKLNITTGRSHCVGAITPISARPDVGVLSYKVYLADNEGTVWLPSFRYTSNGSQGAWGFTLMAVGNKLQLALTQTCNIKQTVYTASEALSDAWHDIKLVYKSVTNPKTLDYALYVDGVLACQGQLNTENSTFIESANLSPTGIAWSSSWSAGVAYIDDLNVTEYVPASGITVADSNGGSEAELAVGANVQLSAVVQSADASCPTVAYSSSNEAVATVDVTGKITAVGGGTATITATAVNVAGVASPSATYNVRVLTSYYSENFNEITELGWTPKNHSNQTPDATQSAMAYSTIEADPLDGTNSVLKLNVLGNPGQWVGAATKLSSEITTGVLKYRVYLGNNAGNICLPSFRHFTGTSQSGWYFSVMAVGGKLQLALCQNSNVRYIAYTSASALSDQWHDIALVQQIDGTDTIIRYALYVDNALVSEGQVTPANYANFAGANIRMTGLSWNSNWAAAEAYIDDLSVTGYIPVSGITMADTNGKNSGVLAVGQEVQLSVSTKPASASCPVVAYSSSNEAVATVDASGKITAVGGGNATITATVNSSAITGTNPVTAVYAVSVSEDYYNEDFEDITQLDWIPKNHAGATPSEDDLAKSYASVETDPLNADNKVMKLNITTGRSHCVGAITALSAKPDVGVLSYKVYLADNEGTVWLPSFRYTANGSQGAWGFTLMAVGNKLQLALTQTCNVKQTVYTAPTALSDAWHDIKLVQKVVGDPKTLDYALYVDGVLACQGQLNTENSTFIESANVSMTGIAWSSSWTAGVAYIDDLNVTEYVAANSFTLADTNGKTYGEVVVGDEVQLEASVTPSNASCPAITYSSSNDGVATVDAYGKITVVSGGTATITATMENCSIAGTAPVTAKYELTAVYYGEDFDEITELDWTPKNHANATPSEDDLAKAYASIETDPLDAENKVMKLNITNGRTHCVGAAKVLAATPNVGVLSYRVYLANNEGTVCLPSFRNFNGTSQAGWFFSVVAVNNKLQLALYQNSNARYVAYTSAEALSDQWHDIKLVQKVVGEPKALDYELYVDDVLVTKGQVTADNYSAFAGANVNMTGISWTSSWTAGEVYIDDLCVSEYDSEFTAIPVVKEYNLSLGDNIGMNFYITANDASAADTQVKLTVAGQSITRKVSELTKNTDGYYVATVELAAAQMTETVALEMTVDGEVVKSASYSIYNYAKTVLANEEMSDVHALVKEMLNYGAKAQAYFGYEAEEMDATLFADAGTKEIDAADAPAMSVSGSADGIRYYGATLVFDSNTAVRFYFKVTGDINSYTFNDGALKPVEKNGLYYVEIADINPQYLADAVSLSVNGSLNVTYSPMNYVVRMSASGSESLQALLNAMYNYHKAAVDYTAA